MKMKIFDGDIPKYIGYCEEIVNGELKYKFVPLGDETEAFIFLKDWPDGYVFSGKSLTFNIYVDEIEVDEPSEHGVKFFAKGGQWSEESNWNESEEKTEHPVNRIFRQAKENKKDYNPDGCYLCAEHGFYCTSGSHIPKTDQPAADLIDRIIANFTFEKDGPHGVEYLLRINSDGSRSIATPIDILAFVQKELATKNAEIKALKIELEMAIDAINNHG